MMVLHAFGHHRPQGSYSVYQRHLGSPLHAAGYVPALVNAPLERLLQEPSLQFAPKQNSPAHMLFRGCRLKCCYDGRSCHPSVAWHIPRMSGRQHGWTVRMPKPRLWRQWRTLPSGQAGTCQGFQRAQLDAQDRRAISLLSNLSIHLWRRRVPSVRSVQPGLVLRGDGAPSEPHRAVALEAAAKRDLPHAVAALDALRSTRLLNPDTAAKYNLLHAITAPCALRSRVQGILSPRYTAFLHNATG